MLFNRYFMTKHIIIKNKFSINCVYNCVNSLINTRNHWIPFNRTDRRFLLKYFIGSVWLCRSWRHYQFLQCFDPFFDFEIKRRKNLLNQLSVNKKTKIKWMVNYAQHFLISNHRILSRFDRISGEVYACHRKQSIYWTYNSIVIKL
jgi:hypothetical protein